jgi:hypothetical protein
MQRLNISIIRQGISEPLVLTARKPEVTDLITDDIASPVRKLSATVRTFQRQVVVVPQRTSGATSQNSRSFGLWQSHRTEESVLFDLASEVFGVRLLRAAEIHWEGEHRPSFASEGDDRCTFRRDRFASEVAKMIAVRF